MKYILVFILEVQSASFTVMLSNLIKIAITLYLQHYINLKSSEDCRKMCFIICHGDIGYMKFGHFKVGSEFGVIKLNKLSCVFIAWIADFQKSVNIQIKFLLPSDSQNIFSQLTCSHPSEDKFCFSINQSESPSLSQSAVDSSFYGVTKGPREVIQTISPPYKYEGMLTLPKDHSTLAKWAGIFSVYLRIPAGE